MKNILLNYFPTVFSLESYLLAVNLKLNSKCDEERLRDVTKHLSSIIIAFDFELNGQYRSYIDRRSTYEQLIFLCSLKANESKIPLFDNHMLKSNITSLQRVSQNLDNQLEVERKLIASDNLSILYFMDKTGDGAYWRQLHALVGSSIMKYLLINGFIFKLQEGTPSTYIQVCGVKFTFIYRELVSRKLEIDEKAIATKTTKRKSSTNLQDKNVDLKKHLFFLTFLLNNFLILSKLMKR